jgi:hypothetical protein
MATIEREKKITISISERLLAAVERLRKLTDADTDSEKFRNAIRLHLASSTRIRCGHSHADRRYEVSSFTQPAKPMRPYSLISTTSPNSVTPIR